MKRLLFGLMLLLCTNSLMAQSSLQISDSSFKDQFLDRINALRQRGCKCGTTYMQPAGPLRWNDQLAAAAKEHTKDMANNNYFSHESLDGRDVQARAANAGYDYRGYQRFAIGENIAEGQRSINEVMEGWIKSPGHCKNLMNPEFKEIGIFEYKYYWVQDFGGRVSFQSRR